jgi:hypothetical protein
MLNCVLYYLHHARKTARARKLDQREIPLIIGRDCDQTEQYWRLTPAIQLQRTLFAVPPFI